MDINYYKQYEPIFGDYMIVGELGQGGFGKVFKIERSDYGKVYSSALKTITIPNSKSELDMLRVKGIDPTLYYINAMEKIKSEVELMSDLKGNSNIVSYENHKFIQHSDGIGWDILIQMELLTPLMDHLKKHKMTTSDVVRLGIDICKGLELCHAAKVTHRDVKLENIFISKNGSYKLGDFGIAKFSEGTGTGTTVGTPAYMAPEVFNHESYGYSVDTYSLGVVMYTILNDYKLPFEEDTGDYVEARTRAVSKRMSGYLVTPPKYGDERLVEIVLKACKFNSKDRFSSATEMRQALEAYATSGVNKGPGVTPSGKTPPVQSTLTEGFEQRGKIEKPPTRTTPSVTPRTTSTPAGSSKKPPAKTGKIIAGIIIAAVVLLGGGFAFLLNNGSSNDASNDASSQTGYVTDDSGEEASSLASEAVGIEEVYPSNIVILSSDWDFDSMDTSSHRVDVIMNVRNNSDSDITAMDFSVRDVDGNNLKNCDNEGQPFNAYGYVKQGETGIMLASAHLEKNYIIDEIDKESYVIRNAYYNTAVQGYKVPTGYLESFDGESDCYDASITNKNDFPVNSSAKLVTVYLNGSTIEDSDATGSLSQSVGAGETHYESKAFYDPNLWPKGNGGIGAYDLLAIDIDYLTGR